jgi:hypothetical protein
MSEVSRWPAGNSIPPGVRSLYQQGLPSSTGPGDLGRVAERQARRCTIFIARGAVVSRLGPWVPMGTHGSYDELRKALDKVI